MAYDDKTFAVNEGPRLVLPVLPLRDVVVYPHLVIPLFVGREKAIEALEKAMIEDKLILLVAQNMRLRMNREWMIFIWLAPFLVFYNRVYTDLR